MFCQTKIQIGLEEERLSFENDWNDDWNDVSLLAGFEEPTTRDVLPDHIHIGEGSRMRPAEVINRASTSKKSKTVPLFTVKGELHSKNKLYSYETSYFN